MKGILFLLVVLLIAAVAVIGLLLAHRGDPEARRSDLRRARRERDTARIQRDGFADALVEIEVAAQKWSDVDSVLAAQVRDVLSRTESRNYDRKGSA